MPFLETTMLGDVHAGQGARLQKLRQGMRIDVDHDASLESFAAALDSGQNQIDEAGHPFHAEHSAEDQIIDLKAAHAAGVMPITR